ncbi:MAG TPA: NAD(P)/FAD-dependent oxidoreductase [Gaiellaceae bacterium]|nr:NAD(P)/FAD-dependent oxidoreductase [Gaiellaceae bacterium]
MPEHDAVVVGSGINGLSAAALLAKAGWDVCVLERNDWFGGCIKTAEITVPGYHHDVFSAWHPLWVGGPVHPQLDLDVEYLNTDFPTATAFPDGSSAFLLRTAEGNAQELGPEWPGMLEKFFPNADLAFGILGTELWSKSGAQLGWKALRRLGREGARDFAGELFVSARDWLESTFASEKAHGLLAPWVLHNGLGPDAAGSGYMAQVIAVAVQEGGMPIPRGGGAKLAEALVAYIRAHGGTCETQRHVASVSSNGVRTADGETIGAGRAVICNVTPTQLYGDLLGGTPPRFRYGRSEMQIHYALSEPPRWDGDERLGKTAIVHLTPGLDGVSRAVNEAERGLLPEEATIVVGQPMTMDPSRAPEGKGLLWIQLQELPWHVKGEGEWTPDRREQYADRIQARIAKHIPNLESSIVARTCLSPADLQAANINLVHGDPYGGALTLDQSFMWRQPHKTKVPNVWHIGASTHPGPGLGGGSGALVAQQLLEPSLTRRFRSRRRGT